MSLSLVTRYVVYGVLFGVQFPIMGTFVELYHRDLLVTAENMAMLHATTPLLWIINMAPIVLGLCGWFIGKRTQEQHKMQTAVATGLRVNLAAQIEAIERSAAVMELDRSGTIVKVNRLFLDILGYSELELLGKHHNLIQPRNEAHRIQWERVQNGEVIQGEFLQMGKDGRKVWINGSLTPVRGGQGQIDRVIKIAFDLTDLKHAESELRKYSQELEESNLELDQFSYAVSHHLKAPLRAISSLTTWIQDDLGNAASKDTARFLDLIHTRTRRMHDLITALLEYAKLEPSKTPNESVNLFELVAEVIEAVDPPDSFTFDIVDNVPDEISVKRALLSQVFFHAFDNAIRHHHNGTGKVQIGMIAKNGQYEFSVTDNGPGIDPAFHEKAFEMFQTIEARDVVENTGIGLAMVRKMIEGEGGTVWLDPEVPTGTRLVWRLPVSEAARN